MKNHLSFALLIVCLAGFGCASTGGPLKPAAPGDASAPAVLWRDPGAIGSLDLFWGSGVEARAPQGPFTFVEEDTTGTNPKITVKDARGESWDMKFDEEVHAEVAANRLVWALGYVVEDQYFVREGTVSGATGLTRAAKHVGPGGAFTNARFRYRNPAAPRSEEEWTLQKNPFSGSKELSGLAILMTLINNWDIQGPRNNKVLRATLPDGRVERRFLVSDLGATFGRMGGGVVTNHSKWNLEHFRRERFIEKVEGGMLHLAHDAYDPDLDRVPLEHARWFAGLASQLTTAQLRRAFEAAAATPEEVDGYSAKLAEKIAALQKAVNETKPRTTRTTRTRPLEAADYTDYTDHADHDLAAKTITEAAATRIRVNPCNPWPNSLRRRAATKCPSVPSASQHPDASRKTDRAGSSLRPGRGAGPSCSR